MKSIIYIDNLKCGGCASTIKKELSQLNGVKDVKVNNDDVSFPIFQANQK